VSAAHRPLSAPLNSGAEDLLPSVAIAVSASAYLRWVGSLSLAELVAVVAGFAAPVLLGFFLDRRASQLESSEKESAGDAHRMRFAINLSPALLIPIGLFAVSGDAILGGLFVRSLGLVVVLFAIFSAQLAFYQRRATGESAERIAPVDPSGGSVVGARLRVAIAIPAIAGMLIALDLSTHLAQADDVATRAAYAESAILVLSSTDTTQPLSQRISQSLPSEAFRPGPLQAFALSPEGSGGSAPSAVGIEFLAAIDREVGTGRTSGDIVMSRTGAVGSYQVLDDGQVLVVRVGPSDSTSNTTTLALSLGAVVVLILGFATLVSGDFTRAVGRVRARAERLAQGDLRSGDSAGLGDDEFASLEMSLDAAGTSFRSILTRADSAATRVDQAVEELTNVVGGIVTASASQAAQVQEAHQLMTTIKDQVSDASRSADNLTHSIDESSNSVLELGAAGDELNETASVLTSKVDAVSDSLEQMVRSVKEVGATTDRLAEASEETSSSMEEMASAMRAVDTAAETTASISRDVVDKAELGQAKVVQTIAGMEAIREATDVAESVIRGLGARTNEIGGILDVIEDVADETNLLALNAAIIAAQAGEQGKAFSVVADEIKELADRVLASTKEIGGLIRAVQDESENAIGAIEAGSTSVMDGVDLSAEAGKTLEEITEASRESGDRIGEIVNSVREQTKAASHVVALMEKVRESADQIGAASGEQDRGNEIVYRSALTMREVAQQVRHTTEEQAAGFGRIRENVTGVRGAVEQITGSLHEQSAACAQVASVLDGVSEGSRSNEEAAGIVADAIRALANEAAGLREDVERFRC